MKEGQGSTRFNEKAASIPFPAHYEMKTLVNKMEAHDTALRLKEKSDLEKGEESSDDEGGAEPTEDVQEDGSIQGLLMLVTDAGRLIEGPVSIASYPEAARQAAEAAAQLALAIAGSTPVTHPPESFPSF